MKLYSVFDLYVVEKCNHKFICKKSNSGAYREFFTKEKIKIEDLREVKPLSNYYPILSMIKPLKLNNDEILNKYIEINQKENENEITEKDKLDSFIIDAWQDYVEGQKDKINIPIINVKELIKKNKN